MFSRKEILTITLLLLAMIISTSSLFVQAGQIVLSNNKGDASANWFITGEPTLIMNGFDLTPLNLTLPAVIDKISIAIAQNVPGATVDVVVYQDANGGSPIDATLAGQAQVLINQPGLFTVTLPTPITITQPVVWIGFYLPVNFQFQADTSGPSVLTYWAWTPSGRFDLANLRSAQVFGPADGSAPVNINMQGIARITAEITGSVVPTAGPGTPTATFTSTPIQPLPVTIGPGLITQVVYEGAVDLSVLQAYPFCPSLLQDSADINITYRGAINITCQIVDSRLAPPSPPGYARREALYDIAIFKSAGEVVTDRILEPVTHCIRANPVDVSLAVIGVAFGAPRKWEILPTLRVGDLVCAEVKRGGSISYFLPGVVETATPLPTATPK